MRKLIVQQFGVSLDGFSATEDGQGWTRWAALEDPELDAEIVAGVRRAGVHIMGRHTYEGHAAYWPQAVNDPDPAEREIAGVLNAASKVVFSCSLATAGWPGTRIARGELAAEVARLKEEPGGEILAVGGVGFARSLVRAGLFDSLRLFVLPYAAGRGSSILAGLDEAVSLTLVSSRPFPSGVVELVYDRAA